MLHDNSALYAKQPQAALSSRRISEITKINYESLSRTGRHQAVVSTMTGDSPRGGKKGVNTATGGGGGVLPSPPKQQQPLTALQQSVLTEGTATNKKPNDTNNKKLSLEMKVIDTSVFDTVMMGDGGRFYSEEEAQERGGGGGSPQKAMNSGRGGRRGGGGGARSRPSREMCSSPRKHPQFDKEVQEKYKQDRLSSAFEGLFAEVEGMDLIDDGSVTRLAAKTRTTGRPVIPNVYDDDEDDMDNDMIGGECGVVVEGSIGGLTEEPSLGEMAGGMASLSAVRGESSGVFAPPPAAASTSKVSPREQQNRKQERPSAAFLSPDRNDALSSSSSSANKRRGFQVPPLGHYRPKHDQTENAVTGGFISPPEKTTPRERPVKEISLRERKSSPQHHNKGPDSPSGSPKWGKSTISAMFPSEAELRQQSSSGGRGGGGAGDQTHHLHYPQPTKDSSYVFKSKVPVCSSLTQRSAAPDDWYWPRNSPRGALPPAGNIDMKKQSPRKPQAPSDMPEYSGSVPSSLDEAAKHSPVKMEKQTPRKTLTIANINDTPIYNVDAAEPLTKKIPPKIDFSKLSPRKGFGGVSSTTMGMTVSVEERETNVKDTAQLTKRTKSVPAFDKQTWRAEQQHVAGCSIDVMYDPEFTAVSPRRRAAIVREDSVGHKPLFVPSITDNCSYSPQLDPVRPKVIRTVDFEKPTPRKEEVLVMHDLVYNAEQLHPKPPHRVKGNPMIAQHVSRDKREKLLAPKVTTAASTVGGVVTMSSGGASNTAITIGRGAMPPPPNLDAVRTVKNKCALDFSKQVTKENGFTGRLPSESFSRKNPTAPPIGTYDVV